MKIFFGMIAGALVIVAILTEIFGLLGAALIATLASIDSMINNN